MRILVAVATRHGATREIAENIATAAGTAPTDAVGGKIDRHSLHLPERAMVAALRVQDGDYRDWPSIRAWGGEIGLSLAKAEVAGNAS